MRIQHNIMAMNSYRNLSGNNNALSKNLEKLSSGYRINRAGDDAAGLAISEKMRAQIAGLDQAQKNAQSGINMVKTAEGALTEVHDMLNRMTTLATQSANGTYSDTDREKLQAEVDALVEEIDRIADNSNFNGTKLLDGSLAGSGSTAAVKSMKLDGAITTTIVDATKFKSSSTALKGTSTLAKTANLGDSITLSFTYNENGVEKTEDIKFTLGLDSDNNKVLIGDSGKEYDIAAFSTSGVATTDLDSAVTKELANSALADKFKITGNYNATGLTFEALTAGAGGPTLVGYTTTATVSGVNTSAAVALGTHASSAADAHYTATITTFDPTNTAQDDMDEVVFSVNGKKYAIAVDGTDVSTMDKDVKVIFGASAATATSNAAKVISQETGLNVTSTGANSLTIKGGVGKTGAGGMKLQIGADAVETITVAVDSMKAKDLGIQNMSIGNISDANAAIDTIKAAIEKVSVTRGDLGAIQNRLEHTINNLGVMEENIQDAESNIRDTDIADEMMAYTKNNILIQSAQAMLAQANQVPQGVLQLMQ